MSSPPNSPRSTSQLKRTPLTRTAPLKADPDRVREFQQRARTNSPCTRRPVSPASTAQRAKVREATCLVCGALGCDPAHLIPRGLLTAGQDDPRAVIPLCRGHHSAYDQGELDLLPYEALFREEMAFAVWRYRLLPTLLKVSNARWSEERAA